MTEWKALNSRISLFLAGVSPLAPSALELYKRVWGDDPDNYQKQPNALIPTVAQGKREGIMVSCFSHPTRIDFNLSPAIAQPAPEMEFVLIEDMSQLRAELMRIIDVVDRGISDAVSRVAFGIHFSTLKSSFREINTTLTKLMPEQYHVKLTDEEDLVFQINQPRMSGKVDKLKMNVLTKWIANRLQVVNLRIDAGDAAISASQGSSSAQTKDFLAAGVSFDINNIPVKPLTSSQQSSLLLEEIAMAAAMQRDIGLNIEGF